MLWYKTNKLVYNTHKGNPLQSKPSSADAIYMLYSNSFITVPADILCPNRAKPLTATMLTSKLDIFNSKFLWSSKIWSFLWTKWTKIASEISRNLVTRRVLTLNMRGPSYLGLTRSISWLLMPWLLTSPGHQQPWYWLYRICRSWS